MLSLIVIILFSYLAGSFPTSIVAGKLIKDIDIRNYGSGNAGGTNVFRVLGWRPALVVALVDIGKGTLATLVISRIQIDPLPIQNHFIIQLLAGTSAMVGHIWTVFAGFRGGKGVATAAGMIFGLAPLEGMVALVIFSTIVISTRYVSLASITAAFFFPFSVWIHQQIKSLKPPDDQLLIFGIAVAAVIIFKHRTNIRRLVTGTESKIGQKPAQTV